MVPPRGIEPRSSVLQTGAMTTSAKAAYCLGCLTGIDPVLPVSQTSVQATTLKTPLAGMPGFEPSLVESKSTVLADTPHPNCLVEDNRIELLISACKADVIPFN